tara:strand:- start:677 stop:1000 length:324 start_codon:yes stop_codon:yes gene_type:complete
MANRVTAAIERTRVRIAKLDEPLNGMSWEEAEAVSNISFADHHSYQNTQARAFAGGVISASEAQVCYLALGEVWNDKNGGWAEGVDLATKNVVTQMIGELLGMRLGK